MLAELIFKECSTDIFRLVSFKNILTLKQLPKEYFEEKPYFYLAGDNSIRLNVNKMIFSDNNVSMEYSFHKGMTITKANLPKLIATMKQAGQRLTDINKRPKEITITI